MPSFSGFRRSSKKESSQFGSEDRVNLDHETEKLQRRHSTRNFFRSLLKSSSNSESKRKSGRFTSVASLESPPAPIDPNKPLPPPPPQDVIEEEASVRPVKNLQKIMSPIAPDDLYKLFSGAPQFYARSEGHHTGAPHPSVAFPWDVEVDIRDLSDHAQIRDEAWGSVTAWPHVTRDVQKNLDGADDQEKRRAHFIPRCRERPSMISMHGIERGTMGFQAALEMGVADALQPDHIMPEAGPQSLHELRKKFLGKKDGLRAVTESSVLELLISVSTIYHDDPLKHQRPSVTLYTELFTQLLFPPSRITDQNDPYSLQVQIEAIVHVLAAPVFVDFGLVEWRIRLGQILWAPTEHRDDDLTTSNEFVPGSGSEKYWLLLQILLSCELLLRLDALTFIIDNRLAEAKADEIKRFDVLASVRVRWSMLLARLWLDNIRIENSVPVEKKAPVGWIASLTGATPERQFVENSIHNVRWTGRYETRQINGLLHFARSLKWPTIDHILEKVNTNGVALKENYSVQNTPAATPASHLSRSSYFLKKRPEIRRGLTNSQNRISALVRPSGWLSNTYLSGLILPGEGLSHFLIATLLENDEMAVSKLGEEANLYGGFVLAGRSFWSSACIVGRVLAAGKGASECVGWISSSVIPKGTPEAWVNIDVEYQLGNGLSKDNKDTKARIWHKTAIEHDGNVIGGADTSSVLPGDFTLPSEESAQQEALFIKLESLDFFAALDSVPSTPKKETPTPSDASESDVPSIKNYSAMMRFSVHPEHQENKEINLELRNDVYFVTAFPCISSPHMGILRSPTSPSFQSPQQSPTQSTRDFTGHPLHKAYTYTKIPLSSLISEPLGQSFEDILSPPQSPTHSTTHTTNSTIPKVLVINCTDSTTIPFPIRPSPNPHPGETKHYFGSDVEMLARALCAERGWNALISRRGRGCLACSVREAGALGWRVILRFA